MSCRGCGTENRAGRRFCSQCGALLEVACPACGAANEPGDKFCGECGSTLTEQPAAGTQSSGPERRLVTVLFADLVGFTTLSEHRDPEEVRELLSSYFDRCRTLIERYGCELRPRPAAGCGLGSGFLGSFSSRFAVL